MGHVTLDNVFAGDLPAELDAKSAICAELVKLARRIVPVTALVVAAARRDNFDGDVCGWVAWAEEHTGLTGSELHHRRAIGDMLLDLRGSDMAVFRRLFELDSRKLLPISRIPSDQVAAFVSHQTVPLDKMSRSEVRVAVAAWLGEEPAAPGGEQPDLPGFDALLDTAATLDAEFLREAVRDADAATKSIRAGVGLLGAALEYHKRAESPDVMLLTSLKLALLDEIREIESTIAQHAIV